MPWSIAKMEWWNTGNSGMRSFIRKISLIKDYNQSFIRFSYPTFHWPTLPSIPLGIFGKHSPLWGEIKAWTGRFSHSMFDVGRSMFDVLFFRPAWAETT
jgi:hypothetical protein